MKNSFDKVTSIDTKTFIYEVTKEIKYQSLKSKNTSKKC